MTNERAIGQIVFTIAALATMCVLTICCLSAMNFAIPDVLSNLTSALIGALTAMLVKTTPTNSSPPGLPA